MVIGTEIASGMVVFVVVVGGVSEGGVFDGERDRQLSALCWEIAVTLELKQVSSYQRRTEKGMMGCQWGWWGWVKGGWAGC